MFYLLKQNYTSILCRRTAYTSHKTMADCDNCNDEVVHVWKHRRPTETMTHRREEWLCSSCHPKMSDVLGRTSA